jgi:tetratricopeptide (TPR) repeat protein
MTGMSLSSLFRAARAEFQAGRFSEAEPLYRQLLAEMPDHTEALADHAKLLAALGQQTGTITNPQRSDGFGAQFQTIIYSVIYAELNHKKFVYTPFQAMEHNYDNDPEYLNKKESLINFKSNFEIDPAVKQDIVREDFIRFFEQNLDACSRSESLKKIKRIFRMNKTVAKHQGINVAIHVRRPNPHDNRSAGTDTPDSMYLNIISTLKATLGKHAPLSIHLYSQGTPDLFDAYKSAGDVSLHLNGPVEETFTDMVLADVLVTSRSSLSYVAGLLSEGDVYYLPFWHPPLKHWKVIA